MHHSPAVAAAPIALFVRLAQTLVKSGLIKHTRYHPSTPFDQTPRLGCQSGVQFRLVFTRNAAGELGGRKDIHYTIEFAPLHSARSTIWNCPVSIGSNQTVLKWNKW
jgi:hypothetical protein